MTTFKKRTAAAFFRVLALTIGLGVLAPPASAGTYGGPGNSITGYGISGYNTANQGQVVVNLTGNSWNGQCVAVRSWNSGTPTVRAFVGDGIVGTLYGNSVFETHTVDTVSCSNVNVVYHRRIIPAGTEANYWQF